MALLIANPEPWNRAGAAPRRPALEVPLDLVRIWEKKILKFCKTKPTEAGMSFRINKSVRSRAKNEPIKTP